MIRAAVRIGTVCVIVALLAGGAVATGQSVFVLDFTLYQNHTVADIHLDVVKNSTVLFPGEGSGPYRFTATDADGNRIFYRDMDISFTRTGFGGGVSEVDGVHVFARLPYAPTVSEITLSYQGEPIHTFRLEDRLCVEDNTCPAYCNGKDSDPDCRLAILEQMSPVSLSLAVLLLMIIGGVLYFSLVPER